MLKLIEGIEGDMKICQAAVGINVGIVMKIEKEILHNAAAGFVVRQRLDGFQAVIGMPDHIGGQMFIIGNSARDFLKFNHAGIDGAFHLIELVDIGLFNFGTEALHGILIDENSHTGQRNQEYEDIGKSIFQQQL
ncbi:hypothetical protein D3C75_776510 [compost metagenome]